MSIETVAAPNGASANARTSATGRSTAAEQSDRFMALLVAQMKNQDPLNPMDNAQMTSQIAQINTVSGIEKLNGTVESLLAAFSGLESQNALQLAGRNVLVEGGALTLNAGSATGGVSLAGPADSVKVEIVDSTGSTVQSIELGRSPAGARSFVWDGRRADGQPAAEGNYSIRVSASTGGKALSAVPLNVARVQAVTNGSGGLQLDLGTFGVRPYSEIRSFL